jgi:hypothetical protein
MIDDTSDLGIDWKAYLDRGRQAQVPKPAEAFFHQMRFQVSILEGALINYYAANKRSLDSPASFSAISQRLASSRSVAHEAELLLKLVNRFVKISEEKTDLEASKAARITDIFKAKHPEIARVRNNFAHLDERVSSDRSRGEPTLFAIENGHAVSRNKNGETQRVSLLPDLLHDAIEMVDGIAELYTLKN